MNRSDFINLLENKVQVDRRTIGEVYELIELFPYFQSAHLLLLKGLKETDDIKFEKQLMLSSIHIADREVLYYILNRSQKHFDKVSDQIPYEIADLVAEPVQPVVVNEVEEHILADEIAVPEEEIVHELADDRPTQHEATDQTQTVLDSARNSEQMISDIEREDTQISSSLNDLPQHSHSILVSGRQESIESDEVMVVIDEDEDQDDESIYYMDPGFSLPEETDLLEIDTDDSTQQENVEEEISLDIHEEEDPGRKKLSQTELIDKFILANPRIEPVRGPVKLSNEDISKPYTEYSGSLITETLAKIYINQGYYSRAIEIYEKLSLKYPEKSSYFASQIELVKEHLKK